LAIGSSIRGGSEEVLAVRQREVGEARGVSPCDDPRVKNVEVVLVDVR
jgi:hypothetical protein